MADLQPELHARITEILGSDRVVLFMKGTRNFPQCGFSATVTQILNGLVPKYTTFNVLSDAQIREGIKAYADWPTIPQLYVDGKFVGGCDIVREMFQDGELHSLLGVAAPAPVSAPQVTLTAAAQKAITDAKGAEPGHLRLEISPNCEHSLAIDDAAEGDFQVDAGGVIVLIDKESAARANGVRIDFSQANGGGFSVDNPNEPAQVKQLSPTQLKAMIDAGEKFQLIDVRTPAEQQQASLGGRLLDDAVTRELEGLDKDTPLVFHCHHGGRSQAAAQRFVREGFRKVWNLAGGIDAWSQQVDSNVPRY
jgi:monothiol glutaredoxin